MSFLKKQNKFLKFISISNNCKKISKFFSVHKFFLDLRFRKIVRRFIGNSPRATGNIKKISLGLRPREIFLIFPLPQGNFLYKTYFSLEKIHKLALKLEKFENFNFFEKKSPQLKNFKKSPRVVEISADLKNKKNSKNKCKRCFYKNKFGHLFFTNICKMAYL